MAVVHIDWSIPCMSIFERKVVPRAEWIEQIVSECEWHGIPVFMKDSLIPIVGERNMRREFPEGLKK